MVHRFSLFLHDDEIIRLRHPLSEPTCPPIEKNAASGAKWRPTSVMEPMDMQHCMVSLSESGFYEGAVSIWNLDSFQTKAFDIVLNLKDPSWLQFMVVTGYWSKETFSC